jgi:hypothetical protein
MKMRRVLIIVLIALSGIYCYNVFTSSSSASWSIVGAPSISASFIRKVLITYHSPAADASQALYDKGVAYQIDPAFALAFFMHESSFGVAGAARVTHSLGNIICTAGYPSCAGRFRWYPSWQAGFDDWYRLLSIEYIPAGRVSIDQIIPVYAPSSENNVHLYVCQIKLAVSTWRSGQVIVPSGRC